MSCGLREKENSKKLANLRLCLRKTWSARASETMTFDENCLIFVLFEAFGDGFSGLGIASPIK